VTDSPPGRDGPPAVAALAVRVDGLRRRIESLATKTDALTSAQQEHAAALDGIAELRHQVEHILAILDNDDESSGTVKNQLAVSGNVGVWRGAAAARRSLPVRWRAGAGVGTWLAWSRSGRVSRMALPMEDRQTPRRLASTSIVHRCRW